MDGKPSRKVLVVDDDPVIRDVCVRLLEAGGYQVAEAGDGEAAIRHLLEGNDPDTLVLLDMTMPGMGGSGVIAELERLHLRNPVIITSGFSAEELNDCLPPGQLRGFLRKPYSYKQLIDCVEGALLDHHS